MRANTNTNTNLPNPPAFVDAVVERLDLKNDAQLARMLRLGPPAISKLRHGVAPLTAEVMLRIHEAGDVPVAEIRSMARLQAPEYPEWIEVTSKQDTRAKLRRELGLPV